MLTNARRTRRIAAGIGIACAALLAAGCTPGSPSVVVTDAPNPMVAYLAQGQDLNGKLLLMPACNGSGCALSGDSTSFLSKMTWKTWSDTEAVGTGIDKLDGCDPNCAAGPVYSVATVVTLSNPVKACFASGVPHRVWTKASFRFPHGLPRALRGDSAPQNPWIFSSLISAARQSCANQP
jgi:hypothetical protein